jgi:hypothetical protein
MSLSLCRLVATAQNHHDRVAGAFVVNAIAGAVMNSHFTDALTDRFGVTGIAHAKPLDPRDNLRNGPLIREG